ncbi:MAG TPA: site-specific DNA-methyltransferase [Acidimicrobiales bacterium]|nr:site-specific DNA-methyltransferase [Acidimicrobiales bacterium]
MGTSTSPFGVGRREGHDASDFYARFRPPEITTDDGVVAFDPEPPLVCGDSRLMDDIKDGCVALVVTSPPYYAGKEYEQAVGVGGVPASYLDYLAMLGDVFAECRRVLEPGGRIAVNVANLGRRPYRSLASDVIRILQDDLGLLLRGEIVWVKAEGASGSCAWGSYRSPSNPVLRDVSERVVVASKGRFDRARPTARRRAEGLPSEATVRADEFLESTLDVWHIPPESARRVGHPAPFPVELPQRLIELYTYRGDLVLDPFLGSGSTAVAAARTGRRWAGFDTDPAYVEQARLRVAAEARTGDTSGRQDAPDRHQLGIGKVAAEVLAIAGFTTIAPGNAIRGTGLTVDLTALDASGDPWYFDVSGAFTTPRAGLALSGEAWKALGRASVVAAAGLRPLVLLTSHLPAANEPAARALKGVGPSGFFDAVELTSAAGRERLRAYAAGGHQKRPGPGFWPPGRLA